MLKITIIAMGNKMPTWVATAVAEYSKRLQEFCILQWVEIPLIKRSKKTNDLTRILDKEMALMQTAIPSSAYIIALDLRGQTFKSEQFAGKIEQLSQISGHLCFLIGGPDGLPRALIQQSQAQWSLSLLTLPHPIVRIVLLEALYRSYAILHNHPYHK